MKITVQRFEAACDLGPREDEVADEAPLEIRVEGEALAAAMRTPGHDEELVLGWLLSEGIIRSAADVAELITQPAATIVGGASVDVVLKNRAAFDAARHRRAVLATASCGLCAAAGIEQALRDFPRIAAPLDVAPAVLHSLPARLAACQPVFRRTGGLHGCALFSPCGELLAAREDVGRHNALDKLAGWALREGRVPLSGCVLMLSGRVSFEMTQKALAAGVPLIAAIGAPSSLAVELARGSGMALVAFLREGSFNRYA